MVIGGQCFVFEFVYVFGVGVVVEQNFFGIGWDCLYDYFGYGGFVVIGFVDEFQGFVCWKGEVDFVDGVDFLCFVGELFGLQCERFCEVFYFQDWICWLNVLWCIDISEVSVFYFVDWCQVFVFCYGELWYCLYECLEIGMLGIVEDIFL